MTTLLRRAVPALLALSAVLAAAPITWAHASLDDSDPAEGETIVTPYVVVARFDEELTPDGSSVVVRDAAGAIVAQGSVALDDAFTMLVDLPTLAPGAFVAHWIAITADDLGKTQGDINFFVTANASPNTTAPGTSNSSTPAATATVAASGSLAPTPAPTPPPAAGSGATGGELIVPIVLAIAVVAALGWFLLRRRTS
jgi:methionine-rich copper-binding protein CopC